VVEAVIRRLVSFYDAHKTVDEMVNAIA
jgi:hypothetical protein